MATIIYCILLEKIEWKEDINFSLIYKKSTNWFKIKKRLIKITQSL